MGAPRSSTSDSTRLDSAGRRASIIPCVAKWTMR